MTATLVPGVVFWLTGLPSSGKTTIARRLEARLNAKGLRVEVLDGDDVRKNLSPELGFSRENRELHNRRVIYLSKLLSRNGVHVVVSFISPYRSTRSLARQTLSRFLEVWVQCSPEVCAQRDVKGLYRKAFAGEIKNLTGVNDPYEEPLNPEVAVNTEHTGPEECAGAILAKAQSVGYL